MGSWLMPHCPQIQPPGSGFLLFPPYTHTEGVLSELMKPLEVQGADPNPVNGSYVSKKRGLLESQGGDVVC